MPDAALRAAMGWAEWPARLQRLAPGPLRDLLPPGAELWLDGAHNPAAARAVADLLPRPCPAGRPFHLVLGLLANKDAPGVLAPLPRPRAHRPRRPGPRPRASSRPTRSPRAAREAGLGAMPAASVDDALALDRPPRRPRPAAGRADHGLALSRRRGAQGERSGAGLTALRRAARPASRPPSRTCRHCLARSCRSIRFGPLLGLGQQRQRLAAAARARSAAPPGGIAPRRPAGARRHRRRWRAPAPSRRPPRAAGRAARRRGRSRSASPRAAAIRAARAPASNRPASKQALASLSRIAAVAAAGRLGLGLLVMGDRLAPAAAARRARRRARSGWRRCRRCRAPRARARSSRSGSIAFDRRLLDRPHLAAAGIARAASR